MKKIIYLIIYIMFVLPVAGWGQACGVLELKDPNTNGEHSSREMIKLMNGFTTKPNSSFRAYIDETIVCDMVYQDPIDPDERELDFSKPVGATAGVVDVSPTGAATYQIPIFTPPGTAGMEPQISIVYNSQGGNGLLGVGWDIAGLSAITRTGQTIYHDGKVTAVNLNNDDRLVLDGNRLILTNNKAYGSIGATYATELETFSRVTAFDYGNGNCMYKVETKAGQTLQYGYTDDSRPNVDMKVLMWRLNKITDVNGNYMTYTYKKNAGESWIEKIEYTGNTNQNPYATITFLYSNRADVQESYIAGYKMKSTKLLRGIKVESEGKIVRRYWFNYAQEGRYSHLIEIIEEGSDGKSLNSTIVQWGEQESYFDKTYTIGQGWNTRTYGSPKHFIDANQDGRTDFIVFENGTVSDPNYNNATLPSQWHLFVANSTSSGFTKKYTHSIDADGAIAVAYGENIHIPKQVLLNDSYIYTLGFKIDTHCVYSVKKYNFKIESDGSYDLLHHASEDIYYRFLKFGYETIPIFQTGDCHGDGSIDYILTTPKKQFNIAMTNLADEANWIDFNGADYFYFIDFDGDGRDEIMVIKDENCKIYRYNVADRNFTSIYNAAFPCKKHDIFFGDFNGDGKKDILCHNNYSGDLKDVWSVHFATGTGYTHNLFGLFELTGDDVKRQVKIADINGDGKDEILVITHPGLNSTKIDIYYYKGNNSFDKVTHTISNTYRVNEACTHVVDYHGDGRMVLFEKTPVFSDVNIFTFHKDEQLHFVQSITDGLNNKTQFDYSPLTKGGLFYTKESDENFEPADIKFIQTPLYAVSKMTTPNGASNYGNSINFYYKGAKIHRKGKGFLGFSEIISINSGTSITTVNKYRQNNEYFNVYLAETKTRLSSVNEISTTTFSNDVHHFGNKRILPYISKSVTTNHLTGTEVTEDFPQYDFSNGNLTQKKITHGESADFTETIDYVYESYGNWGPKNKLKKQTITTKHIDHPNAQYIRTADYLYDTKGNLTTETTDNGITTNYKDRNVFGQPKTITVTATGASPYTKTLLYDNKGRFVTGVTDPLGTTSQQYSSAGNLQYKIDITGQKTSCKYDGFGRLTGTKTPEGHIITTNHGWEKNSDIKSISYIETIAPGRPKNITYYDVLGREVRSKTTGYNGQMIVADQVYNAKGQLWKTSLPYFDDDTKYWTENEYYNNGRIKKVTASLETDLVTEYAYDDNTATVTSPDGKTVKKTYNAHGDLTKVVENNDNNNAVEYKYHASGQPRKITTGGATFEMTYDQYGRQDTLKDPNAGNIVYTYDVFGQIKTQTDARGKVTTNTYDDLRRIQTQSMTGEPTKSYAYYPSGSAKGQLKSIISSQSELHYEYGDFGRLTKMTEKIVGDQSFVTQYAYDQYGNKTDITYSGGFKVKRSYNSNGFVTEIRQADNNGLIWQRLTENAMGQPLTYKMGNNKTTTCEYDDNYLPERVFTTGIQDFSYFINPKNGNMIWRKDNLKNLQENFSYDKLNRLDTIKRHVTLTHVTNYYPNGNIQYKSDAGVYSYVSFPAHGVKTINEIKPELMNSGNQQISYTAFHKADTIHNDSNQRLVIDYGVDQQRTRTRLYDNNQLQKTKYFAASYEKEVSASNTREINYISTPYGTLAAYIKENNNAGQIYYLYKDHLGSITAITNATGTVVERRSFDAWGRLRNPDNWNYTNIPTMTILERGYTGHEHLFGFGLINMNGRMYDPLIGRMLSPDPYVPNATNTQDFNRYTYARNNPLKYTDPDGEWIHIPIMAAIGGIMNVASNWKNIDGNFLKGFAAFNVGAGQGALTAVCPAAGIFAGSLATGATNSLIGQTGKNFSGMNNVNWGNVAGSAAISMASSIVGYGVGQGIGGGLGALAGGAASNLTGQLLANGKVKWESVAVSAVTSWGMYHATSFIFWQWGGGNKFGDISISYRQYLAIQADFQRSRFWRREFGGDLINDGSVKRFTYKQRANYQINDVELDPNSIGDYHTHWVKEGKTIYMNDKGWKMSPDPADYDMGTTVEIYKEKGYRYHSPTDLKVTTRSIVINRFDGSYSSGNGTYSVINPPLIRTIFYYLYHY